MSDRRTTQERILEASRRLFNEHGYARTTLAEIAAEVGITQGNLWYHFRTKLDLAQSLEQEARAKDRKFHANAHHSAAGAYASALVSAAPNAWNYHFLVRDAAFLHGDGVGLRRDLDMVADVEALEALLRRMEKEGLFRRDLHAELGMLARSLWGAGRYWPELLREIEGIDVLTPEDVERGIRHQVALLLPHLNAEGRRQVESAIAVALRD